MIAIGIGANSRAERADFVMAVADLTREVGRVDVMATLGTATFAPAVEEAATGLGAAYHGALLEDLQRRNDDCATRSQRTLDLLGVASIAEAAALVGAGVGSQLIATRRISGPVTVAAAKSADEP